jgi:hypothetical protein
MLGGLISLGKVGVKIVLAGKVIVPLDLAVTGKAHFDSKFYCFFIEPGQGAGMTQRDGADMCIGFSAEGGAVAAKQFCAGQQLGMDFQSHYYFVCVVIDIRHPAKVPYSGQKRISKKRRPVMTGRR